MSDNSQTFPINRIFVPGEMDSRDDLGFLDVSRTPRACRIDTVLDEPVVWVVGAPWLGKTTVAQSIFRWMQLHPQFLGGIDRRCTLTQLHRPDIGHAIPPDWWQSWVADEQPRPAVWLIDGVDEGLDRNESEFEGILQALDSPNSNHLRALRLVLFSRPHAELASFRDRLHSASGAAALRSAPSVFWLARVDRSAAIDIVGEKRFPLIEQLIRDNGLQPVAGLPIVLRYLARFPEMASLTVADVWRGVLQALLGESVSNPRAKCETTLSDRFEAAGQMAAVLTLSRQEVIRHHSPDPSLLTIGTLFDQAENRKHAAAMEVCQSAALISMPQPGEYRFGQRNVQDWFTAFSLEQLSLPSFRSAIVSPQGAVSPRLRETLRLIRTITTREELQVEIDRMLGGVTLPSDATEPSLKEACRCVDQLEQLATDSAWGLRIEPDQKENLAKLKVEGLEGELVKRLRDPSRSQVAKRLLLEIASSTQALGTADAAVELVLDNGLSEDLRLEAMLFLRKHGGIAHFTRLEGPIALGPGNAEIDARLRGNLLLELWNRHEWPAWRVALCAPRCCESFGDSRSWLLHQLSDKLSLDDARQLLPHLRVLFDRHMHESGHRGLPDLLEKTLDLLLQQDEIMPADSSAIINFVAGLADNAGSDAHLWSIAHEVAIKFRRHFWMRRWVYEHDLPLITPPANSRRIIGCFILMPEDWQWLRDLAVSNGSAAVWDDAYWLARTARQAGELGEAQWQQFVSLVETNMPGLPDAFELKVARYEKERVDREEEQERRRAREGARLPLAAQVQLILDDPKLRSRDRMQQLGLLCFAKVVGLDHEIDGTWDDLSDELRMAALHACALGLEQSEPTAIPSEGSFPGSILGEGAAFERLAMSSEHGEWLNERHITRWLHTALFANTSENWTDLIRRCWSVSQAATEGALRTTIIHQARGRERPYALRQIPHECWTSLLFKLATDLISDSSVRPSARCELLEQLSDQRHEAVQSIADSWAHEPRVASDLDLLRKTGRNVLLAWNPSKVLDLVERELPLRGQAALTELAAIYGWRDEFHVRWDRWVISLVEQLGRLLVATFPLANDPEERGGFVTPEQELRRTRNDLVWFLLRSENPDCSHAVDRLAEIDEGVRNWMATHRASARAAALLSAADPMAANDPDALTVADAVKIIDRVGFRLIRSNDDLLDAALEALERVETAIGHDLAMLYSAPLRESRKGAPKRGKVPSRTPLGEDSL